MASVTVRSGSNSPGTPETVYVRPVHIAHCRSGTQRICCRYVQFGLLLDNSVPVSNNWAGALLNAIRTVEIERRQVNCALSEKVPFYASSYVGIGWLLNCCWSEQFKSNVSLLLWSKEFIRRQFRWMTRSSNLETMPLFSFGQYSTECWRWLFLSLCLAFLRI